MKKAINKGRTTSLQAPFTNAMLQSWATLANESSDVIASRLSQLPWMWWCSPVAAEAETRRMFSEKHDAMLETQWVMWQMPAQFWADAFANGLMSKPEHAIGRASSKANQRLISPSRKRVSANRKRLNKTA